MPPTVAGGGPAKATELPDCGPEVLWVLFVDSGRLDWERSVRRHLKECLPARAAGCGIARELTVACTVCTSTHGVRVRVPLALSGCLCLHSLSSSALQSLLLDLIDCDYDCRSIILRPPSPVPLCQDMGRRNAFGLAQCHSHRTAEMPALLQPNHHLPQSALDGHYT